MYVIFKPDKGNRLVLMNETDYHDAMNQMFSDKTKLKIKKRSNFNKVENSLGLFKQSVKT